MKSQREQNAYQMQNIYADKACIISFNCYQQNISSNISCSLVIDNLLPVRVLQVDSFSTYLCWL